MKNSPTTKSEPDSPRATYQDVIDAPRHKVAEIVDGKLYIFPRPAIPQAVAKTGIGVFIGSAFDLGRRDGPGGWWILNEPEIHLGEDILVPDNTGWQREKVPVFPDVKYFTVAPDWVCEVLSPLTRKLDLGGKRAVYAREGVGHLWLVDPGARSLEAFELRGTQWLLIDTLFDDAQVSLPPFEAISFNLGDLWITRAERQEQPDRSTAESDPELAGRPEKEVE